MSLVFASKINQSCFQKRPQKCITLHVAIELDFGVILESSRDFKNRYIFVSGGLQIRVYSRLVAKSCLITFLEGFWNCFGTSSKPLEGLWGCLVRVLGASLEVFGLRWGLVIWPFSATMVMMIMMMMREHSEKMQVPLAQVLLCCGLLRWCNGNYLTVQRMLWNCKLLQPFAVVC